MKQLQIISAGAGSGKTYRLTNDMAQLLRSDGEQAVRASGIFATTFTQKAAAELQARVRQKLLDDGRTAEADALGGAMIGTVHALGLKLLKRFAFEAGVSPNADMLPESDAQTLFNQSLATVITPERIVQINALAERLGCQKDTREPTDWRRSVQEICDAARNNNFGEKALRESSERSVKSLLDLMPPPSLTAETLNARFAELLDQTIAALTAQTVDTTKKTGDALSVLRITRQQLSTKKYLNWYDWAKIGKLDLGKKAIEFAEELMAFAANFVAHPDFQNDIRAFTTDIFALAEAAISQFDAYKKQRGLIDYTDMEVSVLQLLQQEAVQAVLRTEIDLLLVDEFQDTNPIQLAIFLKLTELAKQSIWVGDPKQSIYGFRGADPTLMNAVVTHLGGIRPENILPNSWRSRADLVHLANTIFVKAFAETLPPEQVALQPVRQKAIEYCTESFHQTDNFALSNALQQWHFNYESKKLPAKWLENCTAERVRLLLQSDFAVADHSGGQRPVRAADIAILCRSNDACKTMSEALKRQGVASILSQTGLLETPEVRLIVAALRYILHRTDTLAVAEILRLGLSYSLADIVADRSAFLDTKTAEEPIFDSKWAAETPFLKVLSDLRPRLAELSGYEIISFLVEELDIRRLVAAWGNAEPRLDNIEMLRKYALEYEENCAKAHAAASLGGLLLWLNKLYENKKDLQAATATDAVKIITYHGSKGLEWAITVCMDTDAKLRDRLWGVTVMVENATFDLQKPMDGRWIRFWHNPLADQIGKTTFENLVNASDMKIHAARVAQAEDARLLYVGLTRARDFIILPTAEAKPTRWLNRVWHDGNEALPTLVAGEPLSPFVWQGAPIPIHSEIYNRSNDFEAQPLAVQAYAFRAAREGRRQHEALSFDFAKLTIQRVQTRFATAAQPALLLPVTDLDLSRIWRTVAAFIQFDHPLYAAALREKTAENLLKNLDSPDFLTYIEENETELLRLKTDILLQSAAYYTYFKELYFRNIAIQKIQFIKDFYFKNTERQRFEAIGALDLYIRHQQRAVLIKHHFGYETTDAKYQNTAKEHAATLYIARKTVSNTERIPLQNIACVVYFVIANVFVELEM